MLKSVGLRYVIVALLVLMMAIPLTLVGEVVKERKYYSQSTTRALSAEWGGTQRLNAPVIRVPVTARITRDKQVPIKDTATGEILMTEAGKTRYQIISETVTETRSPVYILPAKMTHNVHSLTDIRKRGIFEVPVYRAVSDQSFSYDFDSIQRQLKSDEAAQWGRATLVMGLAENRSLRGAASLIVDQTPVVLEPRAKKGGLVAELGDPRKMRNFTMRLEFLGAKKLFTVASGKENAITISGDWPHPSFEGAYLPDARSVTDQGFEAKYGVGHFARAIPQVARTSPEKALSQSAHMGLTFYRPNDFYQQAYRAGRYGILFIGLTFLTILLVQRKDQPVHPVQYLMIGLAQSLFVLLMVSFAEQIGFGAAYALASGAMIGLITVYGFVGLKLGRLAWVIGATLSLLYTVLYFILQSADYALLAGSLLCFGAIAGTMFATRNTDWYGGLSDILPKRKTNLADPGV